MYDYEEMTRYLFTDQRLKAIEEHYASRRMELDSKIKYAHSIFDSRLGKIYKATPDLEKHVIALEEIEAKYKHDKRIIEKDKAIFKEALSLLYPNERKAYHKWKQSGFVMDREVAPVLAACLNHVITEKNWRRKTLCAI